jgi:predicted nucleotidyltransferase
MRLTKQTCKAILGSLSEVALGADCYLFGSRTDYRKRGGDIDVLLLTQEKLPLSLLRRIRRLILNQIGEQKLDIVNFIRESTHPFKAVALNNVVKL